MIDARQQPILENNHTVDREAVHNRSESTSANTNLAIISTSQWLLGVFASFLPSTIHPFTGIFFSTSHDELFQQFMPLHADLQ
mmetsp:Transcript_28573/g.42371  ORF Transcript_28573/g.42371 Transcript_28573/m.42371 type:complete len:83 (-) Transcript_28573:63-311(-)